MKRQPILLAAALILGLAAFLLLFSAVVRPVLPPPWDRRLLWLGIVIPAAIILLAGFGDVLALVEKVWGRGRRPETSPAGLVIHSDSLQIQQVAQLYLGQAAGLPQGSSLAEQVRAYLQWVSDDCGWVKLRGIKREGEQVMQLPLTDIYVPLEATVHEESASGRRMLEGEGGARTLALNEVLTLGPRVIITGGPGSGKTTVLLHIAWVLAQALGGDAPALATERLGIRDAPPLPIFAPLSAFADYRRKRDKAGVTDAQGKTLAAFISHYLIERQTSFSLPRDFFEQLLRTGQRVILLLDGLDEVPDEGERVQVRQAIEDLVTGREGLRVVATCRTAAYQDRTALGKAFREVRVQALGEEQVKALVEEAYRHVYRHDETLRREKTAELLNGIEQLEAARRQRLGEQAERLVSSPLLVRMLLIVHFSERRLPQQRAELYMKATDAMLLPDYGPDDAVANRLGQLVGGNRERHRDLVQHLAFHLQRRGEQQGREISEDALRELLKTEPVYAPLIEEFIAVTRLRGSLLEERLGVYRFLHLAFQEFLAARYIAEIIRGEGGVAAMAQFLEAGPIQASWWREPILLIAGYLNVTSPQTARLFVRRLAGLAEHGPYATPLGPAGELAAAELAATAVLEWRQADDALNAELAARLTTLMDDEGVLRAGPAITRAWAGAALGQLGETRPALTTLDGMRWCWIPAGPFVMGSDDPAVRYEWKEYGESVQPGEHRLDIPYGYWLGQFPVTNAQFEAFVRAGGYAEASLWPEAIEQGLWRDNHFYGWYWTGSAYEQDVAHDRAHDYGLPFNLPGQPVVGVSWYEALAFCRWLTEIWRAAGRLPEGWAVQLPSEAEWEKAARGGLELPAAARVTQVTAGWGEVALELSQPNPRPRRDYPWGDAFDAGWANVQATGIGATSRVGCFPQGAGPYGCQEMSGNVWEWTRSLWGHFDGEKGQFDLTFRYPYVAADGRERLDADLWHLRVVRGGSWESSNTRARCAFRLGYFPFGRSDDIGFRVVVSPFISTSAL